MDSNPIEEHIDAVVDHLLRDQDYLLSQEIKHRIEELNQLLVQVQTQRMKVEFEIKETPVKSGGTVTHLDVNIYKKI